MRLLCMIQKPLPLSALAGVPGLARNPCSRHLQPAKAHIMRNGEISNCLSTHAVRSPWVGTEPNPQANAAGEDEKEETMEVTLPMYFGEASSFVRHICVWHCPLSGLFVVVFWSFRHGCPRFLLPQLITWDDAAFTAPIDTQSLG